jgi:alginate O-acetyltransferase complex protein AlgJ
MPFSAFSRLRRPVEGGSDGGSALAAHDVVLIYETLLGRRPSAQEIAHQQANAKSLRDLLVAVAASDERQLREAGAGRDGAAMPVLKPANVVNTHTEELEPFGFAPGTWSADGVAVTGRRGWVFLGGGTNTILDQYRGTFALPEDFDVRWTQALEARRRGAEALGAAFAAVIVPDKLAVLAAEFPEALPRRAEAPAAVLTARPELKLLYPLTELAEVPGGAYLRTDTHLTYAGNSALARAVGAALGVTIEHELTTGRINRYITSGDLGSRYSPPIVEVVATANDYGDAEEVASNRDAITAVGANVGTRQVLRNEQAADHRTAVLFGDSYAVAAPHYQGLAWFLAQAFREVHFLWVSFGWDPGYAAAVGAQVVVCQRAERFVVRPPELQVDFRALAADVLGRADVA